MQIVIDIHEEDYEIMKHNVVVGNPLCPIGQEEMVNKVVNGTPLPKGHGELVYREDVCNELRYMDNNGFITRSVNHVIEDIKKGVPTIIEADKSGKEIER